MKKCSICKINDRAGKTQSYCVECRKERERKKEQERRIQSGESLIKHRPYWILTTEEIEERDKERKNKQNNNSKQYRKEYYEKHKQELIDYQKKYREENKKKLLSYKKEYQVKFKEQVRADGISAYGGKCTCCGESIPEFLTIEHINGRNKKEKRLTGIKMWRKLQILGWPKDEYTLLCFNCNCAKGAYGKCPHQKMK